MDPLQLLLRVVNTGPPLNPANTDVELATYSTYQQRINDLITMVLVELESGAIGGTTGPTGPTGPGGGSSFTYTNSDPMPQDVGGFTAGTTFLNADLDFLWTGLLYPYQAPAFTSFSIQGQATTVEVGTTISGNQTFIWSTSNSSNIQANSLSIRDITNATDLGTGLANDGSEVLNVGSVTKTTATNNQWRIRGVNTQAANFDGFFNVNWRFLRFAGTSANTTLTEAQIEALATSELAAGFAGTYAFASGDYKYFAWPDSFGGANSFKDASTNFDVSMVTSSDNPAYSNSENGLFYDLVSVTNVNGVTVDYRVYRTRNILGGTITIIVA